MHTRLILLPVAVLLAGCVGQGKTLVLTPPPVTVRVSSVEVSEGESTVNIPVKVRRAFRQELDRLLYEEAAFHRGPDLRLTYRFVQYDPGDQLRRWFLAGIGNAGDGSLTLEAKYWDARGTELATIQAEGKIGRGHLGGRFELAVQRAAEQIADFTKQQFQAVRGVAVSSPTPGTQPSVAERTPPVDLESRLQRLSDLKVRGTITEEEYALLRKRLIEQFSVSTVTRATPKEPVGVTGVWKGDWSSREGDLSGLIVLDLKQNGTTVTGSIGFEAPFRVEIVPTYTEGRIKNGKMKGQILTFEVPWGTQPMRGRLVVKGSSMRGTLENLTAEIQAGEAVLKRE